MTAVDLWQLLKEAAASEASSKQDDKQTNQVDEDGLETTVVVLGTKGSGKSSAINILLDKDETPAATIGLEYSYARKPRGKAMNIKDIGHFWELGGSAVDMKELMLVPVSENNLHTSVILLTFDLTRPKRSTEMLATFLDTFQPYINGMMESLESRGSKRPRAIKAVALKRYREDHPDRSSVQPFAIPILLVATKYDQFKSVDLDKQRFLSKALRWFSHMHGAHLLYVSSKDAVINNKFKAILSAMVFKTAVPKLENVTTDYTKPTLVAAGTDSFGDIVDQYDKERNFSSWKQWSAEIDRIFSSFNEKQDDEQAQRLIQPTDGGSTSTFDEPVLDNLMAQKHQETDRSRDEFNQRIRAMKEAKKAASQRD